MNPPSADATAHADPACAEFPGSRSVFEALREKLSRGVRECVHGWDQFWFRAVDPYSLAVLRLLAGGMLLYSHLIWGLDLEAFFGSNGWNNAGVLQTLQRDSFAWSFWWYVPDAWLMPVHVVCCLVLLMFFLGCLTRVTSVLAWLIAISYAHRAMLATFGLDQIVCMLVMYLCLAPCGQYLSVDAWVRRLRRGKPSTVEPSSMANLSMRLVQLHLCVMYFFAGTSKLQGQSWWNGNAVWDALANQEYQSVDMTWLAMFPFVTQLATHATIVWEVSFAAAVWNRYMRPWVLLIGVSMHVGIGMFLGMWTFGLAMAFGYLTFVPSPPLRRFIHGLLRLPVASIPWQPKIELEATPPPIEASLGAPAGESTPVSRSASLIVVCQSVRTATRIASYLDRHQWRVSLVDSMVQARQLAAGLRQGIVVCLNPHLCAEDRAHWVEQIEAVSPQIRFVFLDRLTNTACTAGRCRIIHPVFSLRDLRSAIESISGWSSAAPHADRSAGAVDDSATVDRLPNDPVSSSSGLESSEPRRAREEPARTPAGPQPESQDAAGFELPSQRTSPNGSRRRPR